MNQAAGWASACARAPGIVKTAFARYDSDEPVQEIVQLLGEDKLALVILFVSANADAAAVIAEAEAALAPTQVVGCTTAGELADEGYCEDQIVAIGFPQSHFQTRVVLVPDLDRFNAQHIIDEMIRNRNAMMAAQPDWHHEFTFLMIDGLSTKEDNLTSELAVGLGPVPLFGGSAGDGTAFGHTFVLARRQGA